MNRGDALQWGIQIDTDGKRWNVMLVGSRRADWTFDTFSALVEWLEDQNEGLQIGRMGSRPLYPHQTLNEANVAELKHVWNQPLPLGVIKRPELPCGCPDLPFPPRPGCPHHGGSNA